MADFAKRLRDLRLNKGVSQQELADVIGVNKQTISGYERGIRRPAGENAREIYEQLADYFNVDTTFLMGLSDVTVTLSNPFLNSPEAEATFKRLYAYYNALNSIGREKLADYASDLADSNKYSEKEPGKDRS